MWLSGIILPIHAINTVFRFVLPFFRMYWLMYCRCSVPLGLLGHPFYSLENNRRLISELKIFSLICDVGGVVPFCFFFFFVLFFRVGLSFNHPFEYFVSPNHLPSLRESVLDGSESLKPESMNMVMTRIFPIWFFFFFFFFALSDSTCIISSVPSSDPYNCFSLASIDLVLLWYFFSFLIFFS